MQWGEAPVDDLKTSPYFRIVITRRSVQSSTYGLTDYNLQARELFGP